MVGLTHMGTLTKDCGEVKMVTILPTCFPELLLSEVISFTHLKTHTHIHREIRHTYYGNKHTYTDRHKSIV